MLSTDFHLVSLISEDVAMCVCRFCKESLEASARKRCAVPHFMILEIGRLDPTFDRPQVPPAAGPF
jgi:hypothetical protein